MDVNNTQTIRFAWILIDGGSLLFLFFLLLRIFTTFILLIDIFYQFLRSRMCGYIFNKCFVSNDKSVFNCIFNLRA